METKLVQDSLSNLLKTRLKESASPEAFWEEIFYFIENMAKGYETRLQEMNVDIEYIKYQRETLFRKMLDQRNSKDDIEFRLLIFPAKEYLIKFSQKVKHLKEQNEEVSRLREIIENLQSEIKASNDVLELERQEREIDKDQHIYNLEGKLKALRDFMSQIPTDIEDLEKNGQAIPDLLKRRLNRGIQENYELLVSQKLWEYDPKPGEIQYKETEIKSKRRKTREEEVDPKQPENQSDELAGEKQRSFDAPREAQDNTNIDLTLDLEMTIDDINGQEGANSIAFDHEEVRNKGQEETIKVPEVKDGSIINEQLQKEPECEEINNGELEESNDEKMHAPDDHEPSDKKER